MGGHHHASDEAGSAHRISAHGSRRRRDLKTRMPCGEHGQSGSRPLLHARTRATLEGEALHVRAVGAGEARRPADSGDRVDDDSDHDATDSAGKYFR